MLPPPPPRPEPLCTFPLQPLLLPAPFLHILSTQLTVHRPDTTQPVSTGQQHLPCEQDRMSRALNQADGRTALDRNRMSIIHREHALLVISGVDTRNHDTGLHLNSPFFGKDAPATTVEERVILHK